MLLLLPKAHVTSCARARLVVQVMVLVDGREHFQDKKGLNRIASLQQHLDKVGWGGSLPAGGLGLGACRLAQLRCRAHALRRRAPALRRLRLASSTLTPPGAACIAAILYCR